jgi:hypothetical protein
MYNIDVNKWHLNLLLKTRKQLFPFSFSSYILAVVISNKIKLTGLRLDLHSVENEVPKCFICILPVNCFLLLWPHLPFVKSFVAFCLMMQWCNRHLHPLNSTNSPGIRVGLYVNWFCPIHG